MIYEGVTLSRNNHQLYKKPDQIVFGEDIFQRGNEETECLELLKNSEIELW